MSILVTYYNDSVKGLLKILSMQTDFLIHSDEVCAALTPPLDQNCLLPLDREYTATFNTKRPAVYDLTGDTFTGGRGIDLYTDRDTRKTYAYVAAGSEGWYVIDVTDPTKPTVVKTYKMSNAAVYWEDRGVAVDDQTATLAITENIQYNDGNQYGYVRFYDLTASPADPKLIGREKLAEAFSGIPGRLALQKDFAYIATVGGASRGRCV